MKFGNVKKLQELASQVDQLPEEQVERINVTPVNSLTGVANKINNEIAYLTRTIESVRAIHEKRVQEIQEAAVKAVADQTQATNDLIGELETMRNELMKIL